MSADTRGCLAIGAFIGLLGGLFAHLVSTPCYHHDGGCPPADLAMFEYPAIGVLAGLVLGLIARRPTR